MRDNQSLLINSFLGFSNRLIYLVSSFSLFKNSSLISFSKKLPWKSIIIFLFIFSITLPPYSNIQLTNLPSETVDPASVLNDKQFGLPILSPMNIFLLILFFIFLKDLSHRKNGLKFHSFELLLAGFFLMAELSVITSYNMDSSFVWLLKILFGFAVYFIFSRLTLTKKDFQSVLYAFLTIVFINALVALLQFARGGLINIPFENIRIFIPSQGLYFQGTDYFRVVGLLSHPNKLSIYLAMLIPIMIVLWFHANKKVRILSKVAFLSCVLIPFLALSRWGLAITVFATLTTFIFFNKLLNIPFHKIAGITKIIAVTGLAISVIILSNRIIAIRFSQFSPEDESLSVRLELFSQSLYIIKNYPLLGIGGGNFSTFLINYDVTQSNVSRRFPAPVHSFYLLLINELGIPAFFILAGSLVVFARFFFRKFSSLVKREKIIALALFISLAVFFFNNIWSLNSFDSRGGFLFFLILGLLVNILTSNQAFADAS